MKFVKMECLGCGSPLEQIEGKENHYACDSCKNKYILDKESNKLKLVDPPIKQPINPPTPQTRSGSSDLSFEVSFGMFVVAFFACAIALALGTAITAGTTKIDTLGRYVIPGSDGQTRFNCPEGSIPVAEFGFVHEPPILVVHPTIPEQNRWVISKDIQATIEAKKIYEGDTLNGAYIWVHCNTTDHLPEYYVQGFFSTIYQPKDGQEVIFTQ